MCGGATHRAIEQLDQAELDGIDGKILSGQTVEMLERFRAAGGRFGGAMDRETLAATRDSDIERSFDLPQVFIEGAAQIGETDVVDWREQQLHRALARGTGLRLHA
jgi:hypothetical protein